MRSPEGHEKQAIKQYLDSLPRCWYMSPATFGFGASGCPDLLVCLGGRFVGVEVKRESKAPTAIQLRRMEQICAAGGVAFWGTAEKVLRDLKAHFQFDP